MTNILRMTAEEYAAYQKRRFPGVDIDAVHRTQAPKESKIERRLEQQILDAMLPEPRRNYFFLQGRDLELDFAWPFVKMAVEVQGMAHRIKGKFQRDIEKRALAMLAGWRVLEVDGASVRDGRAIKWLQELMGEYGQVSGRAAAEVR